MSGRRARVSITLPEELLTELDKLCARSFRSRSQAIAEAVRVLLESSREEAKGFVVGIITYRYEGHNTAEQLRRLGHEYLDVIVSVLHVHAGRDECIEALVVRGDSERVLELFESVRRIKGVESVSKALISVTQEPS